MIECDLMPSKVVIPWVKRLGTAGESRIKSCLCYFSNPVKYAEDYGIDFYCELIENDTPTMPFYVQAKTSGYFHENWGVPIKKSTICYWLKQPSPVFIMVFDEHGKKIYWKSVEESRCEWLKKLHEESTETITVNIDVNNRLEESIGRNQIFIEKIKRDALSVLMSRGYAQLFGDGYVRELPELPRTELELKLLKDNVRFNLYSIVRYYKDIKRDLKPTKPICEFLTTFDPSHFNQFEWLGDVYLSLGDKDGALSNYEEALRMCKSDKDWKRLSPGTIRKNIEIIITKIQNIEK